jgi:hypothetical protein
MFADAITDVGSFEPGRRRLRVAGLLAVLVAGLLAAGVAGASSASAATGIKHSAKGGELRDGRLILRGVSGRAAYEIEGGRSGTVSVRRLHRRVFLPGRPATGTLDVASRRGAKPRFKLTKPRYSAARDTVSYRAKPLANKPDQAARARAPRRFGAASLSLIPHQQVASGDNLGNDCSTTLTNNTPFLFEASGENKWDTDTWDPGIPFQYYLDGDGYAITWGSDGGFLRGCSNTGSWTIVPDPYDPNPPSATVTASTTYPWTDPFSNTCTSTNPDFTCQAVTNEAGKSSWSITWSRSQ